VPGVLRIPSLSPVPLSGHLNISSEKRQGVGGSLESSLPPLLNSRLHEGSLTIYLSQTQKILEYAQKRPSPASQTKKIYYSNSLICFDSLFGDGENWNGTHVISMGANDSKRSSSLTLSQVASTYVSESEVLEITKYLLPLLIVTRMLIGLILIH